MLKVKKIKKASNKMKLEEKIKKKRKIRGKYENKSFQQNSKQLKRLEKQKNGCHVTVTIPQDLK